MSNSIQLGNRSLPPNYIPPTTGSPGNSGDGINYPYDPNGPTPNFWINWNDPNLKVDDIETAYENLLSWLKNNPGSCYNGSVLLLQFTTDIANHLNDPRFAGSNLAQFLSNQFYSHGGYYYLESVIQLAAYGCAVSQNSESGGLSAAQAFLQAIQKATGAVAGAADIFKQMNAAATADLSTISAWCSSHWTTFPGASTGIWIDDETPPQPYLNFSQFANDSGFYLGSIIQPANGSNSSTTDAINGMWSDTITQICTQYKGNPWAILYMLMAHVMLGLDQDNGRGVNGYSGILGTIQTANGYISKMVADLNAPTFNAKDFYDNLNQLKQLVGTDPALANVYQTLQSDMSQLNSQTTTCNSPFTVPQAGYYTFSAGTADTTYTIDGKQYTIKAGQSEVIYVQNNNDQVSVTTTGTLTLNYGQLAAMGDYQDINTAMNGTATNPISSPKNTAISATTAMTNGLNSQSTAVNQEMSQIVQLMQAIENFVKQGFTSLTSTIQTFVKNTQSLIGS